jgi:hypothetical protein
MLKKPQDVLCRIFKAHIEYEYTAKFKESNRAKVTCPKDIFALHKEVCKGLLSSIDFLLLLLE